ncbi:MAG: hypothetical protein AMJ46_13950, partial [Latescibacteria bacterium DG_63]
MGSDFNGLLRKSLEQTVKNVWYPFLDEPKRMIQLRTRLSLNLKLNLNLNLNLYPPTRYDRQFLEINTKFLRLCFISRFDKEIVIYDLYRFHSFRFCPPMFKRMLKNQSLGKNILERGQIFPIDENYQLLVRILLLKLGSSKWHKMNKGYLWGIKIKGLKHKALFILMSLLQDGNEDMKNGGRNKIRRILFKTAKTNMLLCFAALLLFSLLFPARAYPSQTAFVDGESVAIGTSGTTLAQLATTFAAGNNFVIAAVQVESTVFASIAAGNLLLQRVGGPTLMSNQYEISCTNTGPHNQRWYVLTGIDTGAGLNPSYAVKATGSVAGMSGEAKILAINGVTGEQAQGAEDNILTSETILTTLSTSLPAGDNVVLAIFESQNTGNDAEQLINARLKTGGVTVAENEYSLYHAVGSGNKQVHFIPYLHSGAPANPTYTATGISTNKKILGCAKIVAFSITSMTGVSAAHNDGASTSIGTTETVINTLSTSFAAGTEVVVIASEQFVTTVSAARSISSTLNKLRNDQTGDQAVNQYTLGFPFQNQGDHGKGFGLLNKFTSAPANPQYHVKATAADTGLNGESKILALAGPPPPTPLYRSVGTNGNNLNTGSRTVEISGSTATFSGPMPDNVGVGDVLQYQVAATYYLAFIHGRTSDKVYTVRTSTGGTPQSAAAGTAVGVYRAYTSLFKWEAQDENDTLDDSVEDFDTSMDLVNDGTLMMVACYGDGEDTDSVYIDSWTTGPDNYIKIYTPVSLSEVGTSQRHNGTWDTSAYRISQDGSYFAPIGVRERYVRIDGLQIESNVEVGGESNGIQVSDGNSDAAVEIHISNCIIRMTTDPPPTSAAFGIGALSLFGDVTLDNSLYVAKIWNNIIYGYTVSGGGGVSLYAQNYGTVYAYNNTCVGVSGTTERGIARWDNVDFYAKNNISIDSTDPYLGTFHADSTSNVSDTGDAPGSNPQNGEPAFDNKTANNYHLASNDTVALGKGADLSADSNLPFSDDIDGGPRSGMWDIGADEFGGANWHVDGSYSGTERGTENQPFNTIMEAVNATYGGDTIHVKGNFTYNTEQVNIPSTKSGTAANPTTLQKWGCSGTNPLVSYSSAHAVVVAAQYVTWDSIDVTSGTASGFDGINIAAGANNVTILNSTIYDCGSNAVEINSINVIIRNCTVYNAQASRAIIIQDGASATIDHSILRDNYDDAIVIDSTAGNIIYNNTFDGNGTGTVNGDGIKILTGKALNNKIYNNILSNNTGKGIRDNDTGADPEEDYNCYFNNTSGNYVGFTLGSNSIETDPKFVDQPNNNFHLESTYGHYPSYTPDASDSPCIDAGQLTGTYSAYGEEPEDNGNRVNMGAYGNTCQASLSGEAFFSRERKITIDYTKVGLDNSGSISNFPVLINITGESDLKAVTNGGHVYSQDGWDIVFRDSAGRRHRYHEIEYYDPCAGDLIAWVKIPSLSKENDTVIWMYYGLPAIAQKTEKPEEVWHTDDGWRGVWHLKEDEADSAPQYTDSTSNTNNGTAVLMDSANPVAGRIYNAQTFVDMTKNRINCGNHNSLESTGDRTVEAWVKTTNSNNEAAVIAAKWGDSATKQWYWLGKLDDSEIRFYVDADQYVTCPLSLINDGDWRHVVGTFNDTTDKIRIYVDGDQKNEADWAGTDQTVAVEFWIGNNPGLADPQDQEWVGEIDEVRVSNVARSADWIKTCSNNQGSPSTFYSMGGEDDHYSYRKRITIDHDQVDGSCEGDLSNFPLLVRIENNPDLKNRENGGDVENSNGYDIIFRGFDGSTLSHEIEKYDGSAGTLVAWVKVPTLRADQDTVIYLCYGNSTITSSQENVTGVWDSNYKGVWHLAEEYGLDFDGTGDYVDTDYNTHHTQTTIEAWIYPDSWGEGTMGRVVNKLEAIQFYIYGGGLSPDHSLTPADSIVVGGTWQHIAVTYDDSNAANDPSIYINGQLQTLVEITSWSGDAVDNTDDYIVGAREGGTPDRYFDGRIDELRIYSRILTSEEINDSYLGKRAPSREGLVIEYLMDDGSGTTVTDSSGNGRDGDMTGHAAAWVRPRAHDSTDNSNVGGRVGSMAAPVDRINGCDPFDGSDDYVFVTDDNGLDMSSSFTVEAWARWASTSSNGYILEKGDAGDYENNYYLWWNNDTPVTPNTSVVFGFSTGTAFRDLIYDWTPTIGDWYHVVGVFDDVQNELRMYVNGTEVAQKGETNSPGVDNGELRIGRDSKG